MRNTGFKQADAIVDVKFLLRNERRWKYKKIKLGDLEKRVQIFEVCSGNPQKTSVYVAWDFSGEKDTERY